MIKEAFIYVKDIGIIAKIITNRTDDLAMLFDNPGKPFFYFILFEEGKVINTFKKIYCHLRNLEHYI